MLFPEEEPEKLCLLYVQQWLDEQGYTSALKALEREAGILYDDTKLQQGAQLMQLVWGHMESVLAAEVDEEEVARREEEEQLLRGGKEDYAEELSVTVEGAHPSSITCVSAWPGRDVVLTGAGGRREHARVLGGVCVDVRFATPPAQPEAGAWQGRDAPLAGPDEVRYCSKGSRYVLVYPSGQPLRQGKEGLGPMAWNVHGGMRGWCYGWTGGDGYVRLVEFSGCVAWETRVGTGGVLCLDLDTGSSPQPMLAVGSMDGSLSVLNASSGTQLASSKPHAKYLVRVLWALGGSCIATASHDQTIGIHSWQEVEDSSEGSRADATAAAAGGLRHQLMDSKQVAFQGPVQDITLLKDGVTLVVAFKGTNYLHLLDLRQPEGHPQKVNMNEAGDDHISFAARHLALSHDGRFLLVSTDTARILMLRTSNWSLARTFFATSEQFHNPAAVWHRDGHYIYVAAVGGQVWVFRVASCRVVAKLPAHKINVRDLAYDAQRNLLITCSFDKSVKIYRQRQQQDGAPSAT